MWNKQGSSCASTNVTHVMVGNQSRRKQRFASVPQMVLVSVVSLLVAIVIFPKAAVSWAFPISNRKIPTTKSWSFGADPIRHRERVFQLYSTEESLTSTDSTLSSSQLSPSMPSVSSLSTTQPFVLPATTPVIREIAIVLNTNAKGVTDDLVEAARDVVKQFDIERKNTTNQNPRVRLLVTTTFDEARSASREIMAAATAEGSTTLVIPVGGDGTLTAMINFLWEEYRSLSNVRPIEDLPTTYGTEAENHIKHSNNESQKGSNFPIVFGYVAMGTGNALGSVVGCLPVIPNRKYGRKRRAIRRFLHKCIRPQMAKREDFRLVLSQLIESVSQKATVTGEHDFQEQLPPQQLNKIEVDVLDLPLIRVRTSQAGFTTQTLNENSCQDKDYDGSKNDRYAFFAGLGFDSLLLQDYKDMREWTERQIKSSNRGIWHAVTTGVIGYTVAMFTRSLPKLLKLKDASRLLRDVRITTDNPHDTYWIDHRRGDIMRPVIAPELIEGKAMEPTSEEKSLLYRGSAGIVATGTVPYYGGGLRLFPFARMTPHGMHLRIGRELHPLEGISRIPSIFEGSFRDKSTNTFRCLDFVGKQFMVEIYESYKYDDEASTKRNETEKGFPVQHSGESMGRCTRVEFTVSSTAVNQSPNNTADPSCCEGSDDDPMPPPIRFVTLMPPRIVKERKVIDLHP